MSRILHKAIIVNVLRLVGPRRARTAESSPSLAAPPGADWPQESQSGNCGRFGYRRTTSSIPPHPSDPSCGASGLFSSGRATLRLSRAGSRKPSARSCRAPARHRRLVNLPVFGMLYCFSGADSDGTSWKQAPGRRSRAASLSFCPHNRVTPGAVDASPYTAQGGVRGSGDVVG